MKNKILKISVAILLLVTLTMTNFIYVGIGLVSYAEDNIATNHENVEFKAQLEENILSLLVNVKRQGYFNGEITLENSNFRFVPNQYSEYVNKIEENKIILNQLNAGTSAEIDLQIEPINDEVFNIGLLNAVSELTLEGIYRDSTQKDIKIDSSREIKYEYPENNTIENLESTAKVITNKVMKVSGEDKRVVQLELNLGLKENNYPIKEIEFKMNIPSVDGKYPTLAKKIDLNTMTNCEYNYKDSIVEMKFTNTPNEENNILWKKQGNEKLVLTLIFEKDATPENAVYENIINDSAVGQPNVKVTLYNGKQLSSTGTLTLEDLKETKEETIKVSVESSEDLIYKGKLYSGIDRQYETKTNIAVNLANAQQFIKVKENTEYLSEDTEVDANVIYNKTIISKNDFDTIFGPEGIITILNKNGETIGTIDNSTTVDEDNNIVIDYTGKDVIDIQILATTPVAEGNFEIVHVKTIKSQDRDIIKSATELSTKVTYEYAEGEEKETATQIKLEESKSEVKLEVDKETLSTIVENTVEMKAILKGNGEQHNLYENPIIAFELPEQVQEIEVTNLNLVYETELKIQGYNLDGRILTVNLEGKQTDYKNSSIDGAVLVVNANIVLDKKAPSSDAQIKMAYKNQDEIGTDEKSIRIVAPKDVTVINSIKELNIETIGQEELTKTTLQRGVEKQQLETEIEIINNNENSIEDITILGTFPTKNSENNIDIKVIEGIDIQGAQVYYSEYENATEDLQNSDNAWKSQIEDASKVQKYLIKLENLEKEDSIKATYKVEIPALLEYNQTTKQGYSVSYTNTLTKTESEMVATTIQLETGIGPKLEAKLTQTVGDSEVVDDSIVKNGEVIKYKVEVSNVGSEEVTNITVKGNVPEGTNLVQPLDEYEYTGASYYEELEDETYETEIDKVEVGETKTVEYEVRVDSDAKFATKIVNKAQLEYGDVIKESNTTKLLTEPSDLRVSVKRITDRKIDLYEYGSVRYFAIIENMSNQKQDNVNVQTNFSEILEVSEVQLMTGMKLQKEENDSIQSEELEYKAELNIGSLEAGEIKVLVYDMSINKANNEEKTNFSVIVNSNNNEIRSNSFVDSVKKIDVTIDMTTNTENQYVKPADIIEYIITIKNNKKYSISGLTVKDLIPNSLEVMKVSIDGKEVDTLKDINHIEINHNIPGDSEITIRIETRVKYSAYRTEAEPIMNIAYAEKLGQTVATTSEIDAPEEDDDDKNEEKPEEKETKMISGMAWLDENANGQKDTNEKLLENIKVYLLNLETNEFLKDKNGNTVETNTNENGMYVLENIEAGKYIVIFEYNKTQYGITKYKVENVKETSNSDAMNNELMIENEKQAVTSTDIIEIKDENISGINIGLIELKDFSLKLDKYVSRILIQNSEGTTVKEYNDTTLAKAELDKKTVNGTTVIIEYKIRVTNIGEIDGYAKKIVDYAPSDMKFSSELNKDWYQSGNDLHNTSLANEKIAVGESKEVRLTLTKTMTENNIGLINNTAEIAESYNELGIADSKSTPGNKTKGEIDYGAADTILSIKTGGIIYVTATIIGILALSIAAVMIIRKNIIKGDKN